MTILVTGATGFIGSHLVEELIKRGEKIKCLVKRENKNKMEEELEKMIKALGVEIHYGDLTKKETLKGLADGVDIVFHLAAVARPMNIPREEYFRVNTLGTRNLLEVCVGKNIKKIVHVSSISAVGPAISGKPVNESTNPKPVDFYGESKLAAEEVVFDFIKQHKIPIVTVRPPMIYGPRDFELLKLFKVINTGFFPLLGKGKGHFEFCFVKNLVQGLILAEKNGKPGELYHLSDIKSYSLKEVAETIADAENKKLVNAQIPNSVFWFFGGIMELFGFIFGFYPMFRSTTVKWMTQDYWVTDISKAKNELNYKPQISLREGVKETVEWYKNRKII